MYGYAHGDDEYYKRLDVNSGLERMVYDDWVQGCFSPQVSSCRGTAEIGLNSRSVPGGRSLTKITEMTEKYLNRPFDPKHDTHASPHNKLKHTAEKLVRQRRARAKLGGGRWETFVGRYMSFEDAESESAAAR